MNIFVTGARSFLGSAIVRELARRGHRVSGSATSEATAKPPLQRLSRIALDEPFDESCFDGCETVVHCANAVGPDSYDTNVAGTIAIAEAAARRGVRYQLFVSSFSAHERATSSYGRSKLTLERWMLERRFGVVRPGLIVGNGGLFAAIAGAVARLPVVPVPTGATPVISIGDAASAIATLVEREQPGLQRLFLPERVQLRELAREAARAQNKSRLIVPVPTTLAWSGAAIAAKVVSRFAGIEENLRGFRNNQRQPIESDLHELIANPDSLETMVRAALDHGGTSESRT